MIDLNRDPRQPLRTCCSAVALWLLVGWAAGAQNLHASPPDTDPAGTPAIGTGELESDLEALVGEGLMIPVAEGSPSLSEYLQAGDPALLVEALPDLVAEARERVVEEEETFEPVDTFEEEDPELDRIRRHLAERMAETREDPRKLLAALYLGERTTARPDWYDSLSEETLASIRETLAEQEAIEREEPTFLGVTVDEPAEPFDEAREEVTLYPEELEDEIFRQGDDDGIVTGDALPAEDGEPDGSDSGTSTVTVALTAATSCNDPAPFWPPGPFQVSEYMRGTVTAVIVYLNRRGGVWGPLEVDRQRRVTRFAHDVWEKEARRRGSNLSFRIVERHVDLRGTSAPPERWSENFMLYTSLIQLGVPFPGRDLRRERWWEHGQSQRLRDLRAAANHFRGRTGTDWAYLVFAVDAGWSADPKFRNGAGAYAYLNGGATFVNSTAWEFTGANHYAMTHELGHVFGALDHYRDSSVRCGDRGGYLGTPLTIHEDGLRLSGCTGDSVDVMDRYSRVWLSGPVGGQVPITGVTRSQVGMTGIERWPYLDLKLIGVHRVEISSRPLYLYLVRYEAEVGAVRRVGPEPGSEPGSMTGAKAYVTPARLRRIEFRQPWRSYLDPWTWDRIPIRSPGTTQVQCGSLLAARWDRPVEAIKVRVQDGSRHGSTGGWLDFRLTGAQVVSRSGGPITLQDHAVVPGGAESIFW